MNAPVKNGLAIAVLFVLVALPGSAYACGSCYGAADSPATNGMNFAILSMIGVTGGVLAAMTSFFLYLRKRARLYLAAESEHPTNDNGGIR
jgi:heme/copper-type cytochrome/quinol oxidase subunit 2